MLLEKATQVFGKSRLATHFDRKIRFDMATLFFVLLRKGGPEKKEENVKNIFEFSLKSTGK